MLLLIYILVGLSLGSFFGVLVTRRAKGILGRSQCPHCHKTLSWYELIPVVSFIIQKGKCRKCGHSLSHIYPALELFTAFILVFFLSRLSLSLTPDFHLFLLCIFILLFFFDLLFFILPDVIVFPAIIFSFAYIYFLKPELFKESVLTGIFLASFFGILYICSSGRWLGLGDVKLVFLIGLALGYPWGVLVTILAIWVGALWGIILLATKRAEMKTPLPFGSCLSGVAIGYILFAHELQKALLHFF
ncbi:MAG TPA: prepilin peptidase [Candidatus Paceibacterota bacterium]